MVKLIFSYLIHQMYKVITNKCVHTQLSKHAECQVHLYKLITQVKSLPSLVVRHEDSSLRSLPTHQGLNAVRDRIKLKV